MAEEIPRRKKRKAVAPEHDDGDGFAGIEFSTGPGGPYCSKCKWEYDEKTLVGKASARASALICLSTGIKCPCPSCGFLGVPISNLAEAPKMPEASQFVPPKIPKPVQNIIESVFTIDYDKVWKILHENLVVGEGRTDHATVNAHLDRAENNARQANQLWANMSSDYERYKIDCKIVQAGMYNEAYKELQDEKESGHRNKTITDGDVESKMAELYPDEYRTVSMEKIRYEKSVEHAKDLAAQWTSKCKSLNTMLSKMRGAGGS